MFVPEHFQIVTQFAYLCDLLHEERCTNCTYLLGAYLPILLWINHTFNTLKFQLK